MVPMLVHVDNLGESQSEELQSITENVSQVHGEMGELEPSESTLQDRLADTNSHLENIEDTSTAASTTLASIQNELGAQSDAAGTNTISGQIKQISQSTGHPTDTSTENSVIGLLKSIVNKLS